MIQNWLRKLREEKESLSVVDEFFDYAVNSILYHPGVDRKSSFRKVKKHDMQLFLSKDELVQASISNFSKPLFDWLVVGALQDLNVVISSKATKKILEKWNFSIETDSEVLERGISREKIWRRFEKSLERLYPALHTCLVSMNLVSIYNKFSLISKDDTRCWRICAIIHCLFLKISTGLWWLWLMACK